jgi:flagellin
VGLRVTTNLLSLNVQRNLATTTRALQRSMQRLSSGNRINTGRDDPAGLAMASGLESQRRGLLQAVRNINDSRGFLDTADGALAEQTNLIQRMRELAVQSSNGTLNDSTRAYLNTEFQSLITEFNRLATQTQFNGVNLLDGSFGTKALQVGSKKGHTIDLALASSRPQDIFTTSQTTSGTTSTASGTFSVRQTWDTDTNGNSVSVADFNGDGYSDFVLSGFGGDAWYYINNKDGTFTETFLEHSFNNYGVTSGDVNGDGKADILVSISNGARRIETFLGNGNGTFATEILTTATADDLQVADTNGDGKLDLIFGSGSFMSFALGNGNGTFAVRTTLAFGANTLDGVEVGDINGDGKIDIVGSASQNTATSYLAVWLGNGNGTFNIRKTLSEKVVAGVDIVDINGDGKMDLTFGTNFGFTAETYLGAGDGTFANSSSIDEGDYTNNAIGHDVNGDGKVDLLVGLGQVGSGGFQIFLGNGNGTYSAGATYAIGGDALTLIDINKDGILDLLGADTLNGVFYTALAGTNAGTSSTTSIVAATMSITTQSGAQDTLAILDSGLSRINSARASLGALQSRLEFATSANQNTIENVSAARSQIMDTDMAAETAEFARLQILQRAGVAVLSQANFATQISLKLLENL